MKRKKISISKIKPEVKSAYSEIVEESKKWVLQNKGYTLDKSLGSYPSPRISSELPDCSMPLTFDHLSHCSMGCVYCFAYFFKTNNAFFTYTYPFIFSI